MNSKVIRSERSNSIGNKPRIYRLVEVSKLVAFFSGKFYRLFSGQKHDGNAKLYQEKNHQDDYRITTANINNVSPTNMFFLTTKSLPTAETTKAVCPPDPPGSMWTIWSRVLHHRSTEVYGLDQMGWVKTVGFEKLLDVFMVLLCFI